MIVNVNPGALSNCRNACLRSLNILPLRLNIPRGFQGTAAACNKYAENDQIVPFVIPSAAEGSAVLLTNNHTEPKRHPPVCHPERSRGSCSSLHQQPHRTEALGHKVSASPG